MKEFLHSILNKVNIKLFSKLTFFVVFAIFMVFILPLKANAADARKAEMYLGDYEISKEKVGTSFVNKEVKYIETGSGKIIKERTSSSNTWKMNYYHTNHQGSTSVVTNNQGQKDTEFSSGRLRYFPYGEQITKQDVNSLVVDDTYTGQKRDTESDLMFYNARLYNQKTGLFMQADSVNDGLNRYMYVGGNPVGKEDPTGNFGWLIGGLVEFFARPHSAGEHIQHIEKGSIYELQAFLEKHPDAHVSDEGGTWMVAYFGYEENPTLGQEVRSIVTEDVAFAGGGRVLGWIANIPGVNAVVSNFKGSVGTAAHSTWDALNRTIEVYERTPALQNITRLFQDSDDAIRANIGRVLDDVAGDLGIEIKYARRVDILSGKHPKLTATNIGTYDESAGAILFNPTNWNDAMTSNPRRALIELTHEVGAAYVAREFGGKANIPLILTRQSADESWGYFSTHLLDSLVRGKYKPNEMFQRVAPRLKQQVRQ